MGIFEDKSTELEHRGQSAMRQAIFAGGLPRSSRSGRTDPSCLVVATKLYHQGMTTEDAGGETGPMSTEKVPEGRRSKKGPRLKNKEVRNPE